MINAEAIHKSFEDFTALDNVTSVSYTHLTLPTT